MTDTRTISPVDGRKVRFPGTGQVLTDATPVVWDSYWERLLLAGDVALDAPDAAPRKPQLVSPPPPPAVPVSDSSKVN